MPPHTEFLKFSDGYSYSKSKLDAACVAILENGPVKPAKDTKPLKKEDIDLIVRAVSPFLYLDAHRFVGK